MEKYNKFRNGSILIRVNSFNTSATETQWKRKMSATNGAGTTEYPHVRRWPLPHLTLYTNQLKPDKTPKRKVHIISPLKKTEVLLNIGASEEFLERSKKHEL